MLIPNAVHTIKEDTYFCQALTKHGPQAEKIRLVQNNRNTHTPSAFYWK